MKKILLAITFLISTTIGTSQISVITNYSGTFNNSSDPEGFIEYNGWLYFNADSDGTRMELWRTDGSSSGTKLFADIGVMSYAGNPKSFTIFQSELYFIANNFIDGIQIWKTDGTIQGTGMVTAFIYPEGTSSSTGLGGLNIFNNELYFVHSSIDYGSELWKTDGTILGTVMIKDINAGTAGSLNSNGPFNFQPVGSNLYFFADDGIHGEELWKTDGTALGTTLVNDIYSGSTGSNPETLKTLNDTLYFTADNGLNGNELWKSDGTENGTILLSDIFPGLDDSDPKYLTVSGNQLFFTARFNTATRELWRTDGSISGTYLVQDIYPGTLNSGVEPSSLSDMNGTLYFLANNSINGNELWKSDGTNAGTVMVSDIVPGSSGSDPTNFYYHNNYVYFQATYTNLGQELWRSDGTSAGTTLVGDINPGIVGSLPSRFISYNGNLVFNATKNSTNNYEPWITNGVTTNNIRNIYVSDNLNDFASEATVYNEKLYFDGVTTAAGRDLFYSSGTFASTGLFVNMASGTSSSYPSNFKEINDHLFFQIESGSSFRLCRTNGTIAGTSSLSNQIDIRLFGEANHKAIYFVPGSNGFSIYTCEVNSNPVFILNINACDMDNSSTFTHESITINNVLYFTMYQNLYGIELWRSDGTFSGTYRLKDIRTGSQGSLPRNLTELNGLLYFSADDGTTGSELWVSDGTSSGTVLVSDIVPGLGSSNIKRMVAVNSKIYFSAFTSQNGRELWESDGTNSGTILSTDIEPGEASSNPLNLTSGINGVYFTASTLANGRELWIKKDTVPAELIIDMIPGPFSSNPSNIKLIDNIIYFAGNDGIHGYEPYSTLGSECSTFMIQDLNPGDKSSMPLFYGKGNGKIFINCDTDAQDNEIFSMDAPSQSVDSVMTCQEFYWSVINDTLQSSGYYSQIITNSSGCDSIVNLSLVVGSPVTTIDHITSCSNYTWIDGVTYSSSTNSPMITLMNSQGCDSVVILDLTVSNSFAGVDVQNHCASYTWIDGSTYSVSTNAPTFTLTNAYGCDSVLTLNLTISNPTSGIDIQNHCTAYTWIDGITYTSSTNTPTFTLVNSQGCDSVVTLNLIITPELSTTTISTCNSYTWTNGTTYTNSGIYTQLLTNSSGCDSLATLYLTLYNSVNSAVTESSCGSYYWNLAETTISVSGTYQWVLQNTLGCDSIVTLNLLIESVPDATIGDNGQGGLFANGGVTLNWIDCSTNVPISGETVFYPTANGNYAVIVFDGASGCLDTSDCIVFDYLIVSETFTDQVQIYPNPTNDLVTISFDGTNAHCSIYDTQGKLIQTSSIQSGGSVSLREVQTGVYFFELTTESGKTVKRVVKN